MHICVQNNESAAMFVYKKKILWELNSFHMLKLPFMPSNFCTAADHVTENAL